MFREHHTQRPAEAARTSRLVAATATPHLLAPHARATREIARARERSDPSAGEADPPAAPTATSTPTPTRTHRSTP